MNISEVYGFYGFLGIICSGMGFILIAFVQHKKNQKLELEQSKENIKIEADLLETKLQRNIKKIAELALMDFKRNIDSINPITFKDGTVVHLSEGSTFNSLRKFNNGDLYITYELYGVKHRKLIYSMFINSIYLNYDKYSIEELKTPDWIISEIYEIIQTKKIKIVEEDFKKREFEIRVFSHDLVRKVK